MNNAELRTKALAKVKDKNFSVLSAVAFVFPAATMFFGDITGILAVDMLIMFIVSLAAGLAGGAGYCRVSMGMWRMVKGGFPELFSFYKSRDGLKRGALPAFTYAVMLMVFRYGVLGGVWYAAVISGIVCIALHIAASWGAYVIEIEEKNCPVKAFLNGVKLAVKNIGRIMEMKIYLYWWMAAVVAIAIVLCNGRELPGVMTGLIVFLLGFAFRWMIGAFIALAEAGLAREAYRN